MKRFLKELPLPVCGVMLGLAALGNLLQAVFANLCGAPAVGNALHMYESGLINAYKPTRGGQGAKVHSYSIGNLTSEGYDLLDKIREDTVWNKTKTTIKGKGLPLIVDVIKDISSAIISSMVEGAMKGLKT